jgi:hypothetical protein
VLGADVIVLQTTFLPPGEWKVRSEECGEVPSVEFEKVLLK